MGDLQPPSFDQKTINECAEVGPSVQTWAEGQETRGG